MAEDGTDRRIRYRLPPNAMTKMGTDGIYFHAVQDDLNGNWPIFRLPFEEGEPTPLPQNERVYLFAVGAEHLFVTSEVSPKGDTGPLVQRLPKTGGPAMVLAPSRGAGLAKLGGSTLWLSARDGLGWVDALGGPMPEVKVVADRVCTYFEVSETHAACVHGGSLVLIPRNGPEVPIFERPPLQVAGMPVPMPKRFMRFQGEEGLLFLKTALDAPNSLSWVSLKGGAPTEVTCTDSDPQLVLDGDRLFVLEGHRFSETDFQVIFSRVDLR